MRSPVYLVAEFRGKKIAAGLQPEALAAAAYWWVELREGVPHDQSISIDLFSVSAREYAIVRREMPDRLKRMVDAESVH